MQNSNQIAVKCTGVKKTYGKGIAAVQALRGIDLEVPAGQLMMIVGPSGSGKTTLISVIAGILEQTEGTCIVFDHDFKAMSATQKTHFRGETIGFVFQAFNLIPTLTAAENTAIPLLIYGSKWNDAIDKATDILKLIGFDDRMIQSFPQDLSGGQQQRVAIARAMVHNPRLIVCDEPTSALDHETGRTIMELLRNITLQNNRALIVVTHDARIFEFADKIARMDDGHIIGLFNSVEEMNNKRKP
jgi:putative ABC transport system ATP-binding protein